MPHKNGSALWPKGTRTQPHALPLNPLIQNIHRAQKGVLMSVLIRHTHIGLSYFLLRPKRNYESIPSYKHTDSVNPFQKTSPREKHFLTFNPVSACQGLHLTILSTYLHSIT